MDPPIAIVLAAGKGTRMKSELPKVLCQANGRPLVDYVLDSLEQSGVKVLSSWWDTGPNWSKPMSGKQLIQFALQSEQLGTGHAVMMCREAIASHDGPVVVVAGDSPMMQANPSSYCWTNLPVQAGLHSWEP